ncbi:lipid transporter family ABC domain protein (macronuclear) [Tetrahymena thermophila SB210]|uniref:Lipid transporter family ABC domain protein n=1 Tax=Tetrahymena thermophila (strain SB210) TaxID=312017 RepID=Q22MI1_TETTS|nr:lipid transporter family ABC domain protein [Tetrahymena thermophila SB210]EAR86554.2 lipid transporter family ABC domain protein [Tetrahymena thermophila SB210]|eukprot:XP_977039.2 lipid transporter family ABC domain protein [Tetrahymena thermophila SB210]
MSVKQNININNSTKNNQIEKSANQGVDIVWNNVTYEVNLKNTKRQVLRGVSGISKKGQINVIMGSSGAGKTTLLNLLCCRAENTSKVSIKGEIRANGKEYNSNDFSNFAAYVTQEDCLMEAMTVREIIQFSADLKTRGSQEEKKNLVDQILKMMRLEKCQNSLIGGLMIKGITKGEKKRTSIAIELVSNPDVIFLDEPTSGLDSFTAYNVIDVLQKYAREQNKNIICTIHQPSSEIFMKFDNLLLLVEGQFIYQGPCSKVIEYFAQIGFQCPFQSNPADYLMSIVHAESQKNRDNYSLYFETYQQNLAPIIQDQIQIQKQQLSLLDNQKASFFKQLGILIERQYKNLSRNPMLFQARLIQSALIGIFIGIIYLPLPSSYDHRDDQRLVNDLNGAMFFLIQNSHMNSLLPIVLCIPLERNIFLKEQNQKLYHVLPYFLSKLIVEIIMVFLAPLILGSISYFMIGLNPNFGKFCFYQLVSFLQSFAGNAQGMFIGALFSNAQTAITVAPLVVLPFYLFGGLFKNISDFPEWNSWFQYLTSYRYSFEALVHNNYEGSPFTIDVSEQLNFTLGKWNSVLYLFCLGVGFQIIAYFTLKMSVKKLQ